MDSLNLILDVRKFINEGTEKKKRLLKKNVENKSLRVQNIMDRDTF